jgi:Flp pilus assembly pilin Flp
LHRKSGGTSKGGRAMNVLKEFWKEEDAVGVVEIILILVVLIGLVIIFKEQLTSLVENILSKITSQSNSI